jgi:protein-tyrosine phosphatase
MTGYNDRAMVDIHCHILPQVDDGATSWEVSTEMCRIAVADGITHIVATPHANEEYVYHREEHAARLQELQKAAGEWPLLSLGCDFHFSFDNVQELFADRSRFVIGETGYLLVELSDYAIPPRFSHHLADLLSSGIRPVITHPERNAILQRQPEQILEWAEGGSVIQITANSLTGHWGKTAEKIAHWLLARDAVHVVATDAHDTRRRPPLLSPARRVLTQLLGEAAAQALVESNPGAIVGGAELPYFPLPVRKQ